MHPEVVDNKAGQCPLCAMTLVPVRLDLVWTCPLHPEVTAKQAGTCRICKRDLVRIIKALSWTCRVHQAVDELNPGVCPTCKRPLVERYSDRPHGDHNPKHGGFFSMAPNNWHIESTHPAAGVFQLYVYDEYSKPFIPVAFSARLLVRDVSVPFERAANGRYLEARVPTLGLPATIAIKARFLANEPEYHFDFFFSQYSKEPSGNGDGMNSDRQ